jgi:methionyl-tRNA formyltransferase
MKVVLAAEEAAGVHALRLLSSTDGVLLDAVLTSPPAPRGATVASLADDLELPRLDPGRVCDPAFGDWIGEREVDLLINVHSLRIADGAVVEAPRLGSFNVHPGPLPRYAGLNSPSWAIAEGEERHAVTVHRMTATVDTGEIAYESWFDIGPADTGLRVATRCAREGVALLKRLIEDAAGEGVPALAQAPDGRRWYGREVPHEGVLPWDAGARRVVDLVRAADYAPFPSPWGTFATSVGGERLEIVRVARTGEPADAPPGTVGAAREGGVPVSAGDEWVLVERVRREGAAIDPATILSQDLRCESG